MQTARRLAARRLGLICLTALLASGLIAAPGLGQDPNKPKVEEKIDRESFQKVYERIQKQIQESPAANGTADFRGVIAQDIVDVCKINPALPQCALATAR